MALERLQRSENIVALAEELGVHRASAALPVCRSEVRYHFVLLTWSLAGLQARQEWRG
jgi:hypothetical protein